MNSYDVAFSLRMALINNLVGVSDVKIVYEGVELTNVPKPFATIEYLQGSPESLAAGRRSYSDTFNFQLGIFTEGISERFQLESKVRELLRKPEGYPLYRFDSTTNTFVPTETLMPVYENGFTPIGNDDNSNETFSFHGYFDVEVEIIT